MGGASKNRVVTMSIVGGGNDGDNETMVGEKLGEVKHGDHVALSHEGEEKNVSGGHGRVGWKQCRRRTWF